ncbi:MAG: BrnT family toxin [Rickettsiales bacterium]
MTRITYDPTKSLRNVADRGISFEEFLLMDGDSVVARVDARRDYGEKRMQLYGLIGGRLHVAVVTPKGNETRVISLRKANPRERKWYEKEATQSLSD